MSNFSFLTLLHKKLFIVTLIFLGLTVAFFFNATIVSAQNNTISRRADLLVESGKYQFSVPGSLIETWRGSYRQKRIATLLAPRQSVGSMMAFYYFGQKANSNSVSYATYEYNPEAVYQWVGEIAKKTESQPKNPELQIVKGRATHFVPPVTGVSVDAYSTTFNIIAALESSSSKAELAVRTTEPQLPLSDLNSLGIKELIGQGKSTFNGSPKNRRINIKVGVEKQKGTIIMPGEEFSFNKFLGPVEKEFGFVPELVIKADGTKPELGGGLCQVSSTTFRAAMNAGLPITQRKNHSYAVQYYAPQGTDATIYPGVIDLKFKNDTPGAILIWPYLADDNTLIFDFYGTKDSREIVLEKPFTFDRKSDGSMKATWVRKVTKNGQTKTDTFQSVYLSPALFHKEEQFVPATTTPPVVPTPATGEVPPTGTNPEQTPTPNQTQKPETQPSPTNT